MKNSIEDLMLLSSDADPSPSATDTSGKPKSLTSIRSSLAVNTSSLTTAAAAVDGWAVEIAWTDARAVSKAESYHLGYLDRKYIYTSRGSAPLLLLIHTSRMGPLWLCELQKGFGKYPGNMGDLDTASAVYVHSNVTRTELAQYKANNTALRGEWGLPWDHFLSVDRIYVQVYNCMQL